MSPDQTMSDSMTEEEARAARRRREKPQLSCNLCRRRKLRCDRSHPCQNCSRRGLSASCEFPNANTAPVSNGTGPSTPSTTVKDRVQQLEAQVDLLLNALNRPDATSSTAQPTPENFIGESPHLKGLTVAPLDDEPVILDAPGLLELGPTGYEYVGSSHWLAIVNVIPGITEVLQQASSDHLLGNQEANSASNVSNLLSYNKPLNKQDVFNALPPRSFADNLVAACFSGTDNEAMIVHPQTFRREYERFWSDPASVSMLWLAQLFALMCLAVRYELYSQDEARRTQVADSNPEDLVQLYREKMTHCLVLGNWGQGSRYCVEALLLYLFTESLLGDYNKGLSGPWIIWGSLIRIAQKSGYHRDGSQFPGMSCFEAERRRRVWAIIVGWDMYLSMQSAQPRTINPSLCDTREPRNLYDEDIYEDIIDLPSARPQVDMTMPAFHNAKNRLLMLVGEINDLAMTVMPSKIGQSSYQEVLRLDQKLTSTYESLKSVWLPHIPQDNGSTPRLSATTSVRWTFLSFIYHRAQIVLHRKYMPASRKYAAFAYSRKVCIEAAITILQHQWVLYLETQVGGELCRNGWKFLILLAQDFLFSTSIVCAELAQQMESASPQTTSSTSTPALPSATGREDGSELETRERVFQALSSSYIVWLQSNDSDSSREVKTVVIVLKHLLNRAQEAGFGQVKVTRPTPRSMADDTSSNGTPMARQQADLDMRTPAPNIDPNAVYFAIGNFPI